MSKVVPFLLTIILPNSTLGLANIRFSKIVIKYLKVRKRQSINQFVNEHFFSLFSPTVTLTPCIKLIDVHLASGNIFVPACLPKSFAKHFD